MQKTNEVCTWRECGKAAIARVLAFENRVLVGDICLCEPHLNDVVRGYRASRPGLGKAIQYANMRTCDVETLVVRLNNRVAYVVMRECEGMKHFVLQLGDCDLFTLAWNMRKLPFPIPTTDATLADILKRFGGLLKSVSIFEFVADHEPTVYRAMLQVDHGIGSFEQVVRPTDALNLAHVCNVPIFVATEFLK